MKRKQTALDKQEEFVFQSRESDAVVKRDTLHAEHNNKNDHKHIDVCGLWVKTMYVDTCQQRNIDAIYQI